MVPDPLFVDLIALFVSTDEILADVSTEVLLQNENTTRMEL